MYPKSKPTVVRLHHAVVHDGEVYDIMWVLEAHHQELRTFTPGMRVLCSPPLPPPMTARIPYSKLRPKLVHSSTPFEEIALVQY